MTLHLQRLLYRALNPVYARDPLSGRGAQIYGGRLNPKGVPALYTSTAPETAIRESNQIGTLQPTTLVAYAADIHPIFDGTDPAALAGYDMTPNALADPGWRDAALAGRSATQDLARALIDAGFAGIQLPSYAKGAPADATNVVLWKWGDPLPHQLRVIDDNDRLGRKSGA